MGEDRTADGDPFRFYVYAHIDWEGKVFYIGKGTGERAWSTTRDHIWKRYVSERTFDIYSVEILEEDLTESEALSLEERLITEYRQQLVNWQGGTFDDPGPGLGESLGLYPPENPLSRRAMDERAAAIFDLSRKYQALRAEARALAARAKDLQATNPEAALSLSARAFELERDYTAIHVPHPVPLVEDLMLPSSCGDIPILHRHIQILKKLGRFADIVDAVDAYLAVHPDDRDRKAMQPILANRAAALARLADAPGP